MEQENKNFVFLIMSIVAIAMAWLFMGGSKPKTGVVGNQPSYESTGTLLVNLNGSITDSSVTIDNSRIGPSNLWTSDKISNMLANVGGNYRKSGVSAINDNAADRNTTWSSERLKYELNRMEDRISRMSSMIFNDNDVSNTSTWSSEKIMGMLKPVAFFDAIRNTSITTTGVITYDAFMTNARNSGMNLNTGIFTVPKAGLYRITFTALRYYFVNNPVECRVRMFRNDNIVLASAATTNALMSPDANIRPSGGESLNINVLVNLIENDKIVCKIESGGIYDNDCEHLTHFTAELLVQPTETTQDDFHPYNPYEE